jgi:hypothetical protein
MNYLQLCAKMRRDIGIQGSGPTSVTSQTGNYQRIVDYIADADDEIQSLYEDWDFLRTTVAFNTISATSTYTTAAISAGTVGKWDVESFAFKPNTTSYRPLSNVDFHDWKNSGDRYYVNTDDEPTQFVIDQNESIILIPTPDAVYAVQAEHWVSPSRMAANTDTSVIPSRFHQMIIELATIKYGTYDENNALITAAMYQYDKVWLPRLEAAELRGSKKSYSSHDPDFIVTPV